MGCQCCKDTVAEEKAFQEKARIFSIDNKIFTLRKYGKQETETHHDPYLKGCNGIFESFKETKTEGKNEFKKKSVRKSSKLRHERGFIRTCSMEEFCDTVAQTKY